MTWPRFIGGHVAVALFVAGLVVGFHLDRDDPCPEPPPVPTVAVLDAVRAVHTEAAQARATESAEQVATWETHQATLEAVYGGDQ